jgi:hypothetical protein
MKSVSSSTVEVARDRYCEINGSTALRLLSERPSRSLVASNSQWHLAQVFFES